MSTAEARLAEMEDRVARLSESIAYVTENRELLERRREEIAEAAYVEISRSGFRDASVSAIAKRVGIDKRTLYDYVGDKDDILFLVFLHYLPKLLRRMCAASNEAEGDPLAQLRAIAHEHVRYQEEHPRIGLLYFRELRHLQRDQIAEVLWMLSQFIALYEEAIRDGVDEGIFAVSEPHVAARAVAAVLDMASLAGWDLNRHGYDTIEKEGLNMVIDGLRTRDTADSIPALDGSVPVSD